VGPRASVDRCRKSHPPLGFDPRTVQPLASCHTDYAILAHPAKFYVPQSLWNVNGELKP
jgi:hypothetical protein